MLGSVNMYINSANLIDTAFWIHSVVQTGFVHHSHDFFHKLSAESLKNRINDEMMYVSVGTFRMEIVVCMLVQVVIHMIRLRLEVIT